MNIRTKLILGFGFMVVMTTGMVYTAFQRGVAIQKEHAQMVTQRVPLIEALENLRYAGLRIVSSTSEFAFIRAEVEALDQHQDLRAAEAEEEELIREGKERYDQALLVYADLVTRYFPDKKDTFTRVREMGLVLQEKAANLIRLKKEGQRGHPVLDGKAAFEDAERAFIHTVEGALVTENSEINGRRVVIDQMISIASTRLIVVTGILFVLALGMSLWIGRLVSGPVKRLLGAFERVEAGRLDTRIVVSTQDEMGRLSHSFNRMVGNLEESNEELEKQRIMAVQSDRLRSLGEMAAGVAHELNQPLVGVRGFAEHTLMAIENNWNLSPDTLKEHMTHIVNQSDRMVHIIQHMRQFAREAGSIETVDVLVNEVIDAALLLMGTQLRARGVSLETQLADMLPTVKANAFSLEEVILNLLGNAQDAVLDVAAQRGEGFLPKVVIATYLQEEDVKKMVVIEVRDNGSGIKDEILERIFDPFFTTKGPDKGTGLGLSISKSIVEMFGGTIQVQTTTEAGTTFDISLPVQTSEEMT